MQAILKDGYLEAYATVGNLEGAIEIDVDPEELELEKINFYKYNEDTKKLELDTEKINEAEAEQQAAAIDKTKKSLIMRSKKNLEKYLQEYKVVSKCHGDIEKQYSVTTEKQQHLASMILTAQVAAQAGMEYKPSWNATGEECSNDWTIEELQQLAMEIEAVVRPLVTAQQKMEVAINKAATLEELEAINITFGEGVK